MLYGRYDQLFQSQWLIYAPQGVTLGLCSWDGETALEELTYWKGRHKVKYRNVLRVVGRREAGWGGGGIPGWRYFYENYCDHL